LLDLSAVLGSAKSPFQAICAVPGDAWRLPADVLRDQIDRGGAIGPVLRGYIRAVLAHIAQSVVCASGHSLAGRYATWLLLARDRVSNEALGITPREIGALWGVPLSSVRAASATLHRAGAIVSGRTTTSVTSSAVLEAAACPCYRLIRTAYDSS
jgi:hypothetical protein